MRIELEYDRGDRSVRRVVDPLGIVLKAGNWYLVAAHEGQLRTYRVSRVLDVEATEDRSVRPDGFDLSAYWTESTAAYERDAPRIEVTLRARRGASRWLEDVIDTPVLASGTELVDPDPAWRTLRLTLDWPREVAGRLLALGGAVEVLEPPELRAEIAALAAEAAAIYAAGAAVPEAGPVPADARSRRRTPGAAPGAARAGWCPPRRRRSPGSRDGGCPTRVPSLRGSRCRISRSRSAWIALLSSCMWSIWAPPGHRSLGPQPYRWSMTRPVMNSDESPVAAAETRRSTCETPDTAAPRRGLRVRRASGTARRIVATTAPDLLALAERLDALAAERAADRSSATTRHAVRRACATTSPATCCRAPGASTRRCSCS